MLIYFLVIFIIFAFVLWFLLVNMSFVLLSLLIFKLQLLYVVVAEF